jgi:hypothetical protein
VGPRLSRITWAASIAAWARSPYGTCLLGILRLVQVGIDLREDFRRDRGDELGQILVRRIVQHPSPRYVIGKAVARDESPKRLEFLGSGRGPFRWHAARRFRVFHLVPNPSPASTKHLTGR